jgi:hypothetical protein
VEQSASLRAHAWLCLAFALTRVWLYRAGLRMNFDLRWMWLADPLDLRERLAHTLFYFHATPPGMNLLTGLVLKVAGAHAATLALVIFAVFSLVVVNSIFFLGRTLGLSLVPAFCLALAVSSSPAALFFDHLYLYESPVVALVTLSAALLLHALRAPSFSRWFAFFLVAAALGFVRSTFHLVWLVLLVLGAVFVSAGRARRTVLAAAALPLVLLSALYVKNAVVFGFFGAFSEASLNLNMATTRELPRDVREALIDEGKLSRFADVDVFSGPRAYLPFFASAQNPDYPPELSSLERPSIGAPNYNHWFFLATMSARRHDALESLAARPRDYLRTVAQGFVDFFSPTTRWHPAERRRAPTPHDQHRTVLGGYERVFNGLVHSFPVPPVGLYVFLPLPLAWAVSQTLRRACDSESRARTLFFGYVLLQIGYVVTVSTLFSFKESARYRYQIEPLLWLLSALALSACMRGRQELAGRPTKSN